MHKLSENKTFKVIKSIFKFFVILVLVGFIFSVCLQRFSDNKISFFKYRMFTVVSGSMKPVYDIGDVLISKEVDPSKIKRGDVISYEGKVGEFKDKVITHEVIEIEKDDETGKYVFHTKGKTNAIEDPIVSEDQVYGVVLYKVLLLSIIYRIIGTNIGFYLFIIIPLLYIIGSEIIMVMLDKEEKRRSK